MPNLTIYPIFLFLMALLAIVSGIGVFWTIRKQRAGWFTTFIWMVFSASISAGFITFGLFTYVTGGNEVTAISMGGLGIVAVILVCALSIL